MLLVIGVFFGALWLEIINGKSNGFLDGEFWLNNLLPNIIADMIGIIFTSFIIAGLFARNNKKAEEARIYGVLGVDFRRVMSTLSRNYLYLLTNNEKYLSLFISDEQVNEELKEIIRNKGLSIDLSVLNSNRTVWDISHSSTIYDNYIIMIPRIEAYQKVVSNHFAEVEDLFIRKAKVEFELRKLEENSDEYEIKKNEYDEIKKTLKKAVRIDTSIDKKLLNVRTSEALLACFKLYQTKIKEFYEKHNFLIPIDMRLEFADLEKSLNQVHSSYVFDVNEDERIKALIIVSENLVNLSGHFKKIG